MRRSHFSPFGKGAAAVPAGDQQRHHNVLEGGELGQQVVALPDIADLGVAVGVELGLARRGQLEVAVVDAPFGRRVERRQQVQQSRLAGAGLADQRHALARMELERDVLEDRSGRRAPDG